MLNKERGEKEWDIKYEREEKKKTMSQCELAEKTRGITHGYFWTGKWSNHNYNNGYSFENSESVGYKCGRYFFEK